MKGEELVEGGEGEELVGERQLLVRTNLGPAHGQGDDQVGEGEAGQQDQENCGSQSECKNSISPVETFITSITIILPFLLTWEPGK